MPRSRRNNHRRSITSIRNPSLPQPHRPPRNDHAPLPLPHASAQPQQPTPPPAQQGFGDSGRHPSSPRGGFGSGRGRDHHGNGWSSGGEHQNNNTNRGSSGWTTTETGSGNGGGGQNNNTGSSGWTATDTAGRGFPGVQGAGDRPVEWGDVHMGSSTADGSGVRLRWGSDGPGNGGGNNSNYNHGHNNEHHGGRGQRGGRGEWWGDRGGRGGRGGGGGRGDWGSRGDKGGIRNWGGRGRGRGRGGGRGGRGAWGGQGAIHDAPNAQISTGWGETSGNTTNQPGQEQGAEPHATSSADASFVWGGTGANAVGMGNNSAESPGAPNNDVDANGCGWGISNSTPQAAWTSTEIERNKRPLDQGAGNAAKKLKSYVIHELEQVRRRIEEWEAGWDAEREGEGIVERTIEGGWLVEKMVWQSEATFLVVWPAWLWGAAAAGLGDMGARSRFEDGGVSWAKSMQGRGMMRTECVVEPE